MSDPDDRDLLAAEYVLGTLDAAERADVTARLGDDVDLARAVSAWEDRLAPLAEALPGIVPPAAVYAGLVVRLFGAAAARPVFAPSSSGGSVVALKARLRRWQAATGGLTLLAASLLAWVAVREGVAPAVDRPRFTAVLQRDAGAPAMLLDVDLSTRRLTIRPLAASAPAGHAYQLWIIDPALGAPRSLGVLPTRAGVEESLSGYDDAVITDATYAVTIEPAGGSPTGQPSAPPILIGKLAASRS